MEGRKQMSTLFEQIGINGMTLKNRTVRSATWEGMCDPDGRPTKKLIQCYRDLALGGVGLIVSGYAFVRSEGRQAPGKMGIHTDAFAEDYQRMTHAVHEAGGRIAVQLVHAGGQTSIGMAGRQPIAPSAVKVEQYPEMPAALSKEEIEAITAAFGQGAGRAKSWGCDAVQLHGAHGYLINQFLSPLTNRREDDYGGTIENRSRFLVQVYERVRQTVGPDYPVLIKLNASDNLAGGLDIEDAVYAAGILSRAGINAIEVSAGTSASGAKNPARMKISKPEKEAYNLDLARRIKEAVDCPVMVVGGFRSYEVAEKVVGQDGMDAIALARPLVREPALINRWQQGDRAPARCISCNSCFVPASREGGIYCVVEKKEKEKEKSKKG
jgi:2,4-dienoyl-CoA reductase-like NADH-dependent reductase (Old Yellow Enzyme family)